MDRHLVGSLDREQRIARARQQLGLAVARMAVIEAVLDVGHIGGPAPCGRGGSRAEAVLGHVQSPSGAVEGTPAAGRWGGTAPEGEHAGRTSDAPAGEGEMRVQRETNSQVMRQALI